MSVEINYVRCWACVADWLISRNWCQHTVPAFLMEEKMSEDKKNYYAIIPATVRYDKKLKANAKLLYGEITALCNERGYCWASNAYFANLYEVSNQAISSWIKLLEKQGYVKIEYEFNNNQITRRKVSINTEGVSINVDRGINKCLGGYQQKLKDNNTVNNTYNNTYNNLMSDKNPTAREAEKIPYEEILSYLNEKTGTSYRHTTPKNRELIRARWKEGFCVDDFKKVVDNKVRDWKGDVAMKKYLRPITLFGTKFESYLNETAKKKYTFESKNPY
jgi:uncharacterized phage protein (TIGR02220 family)